MDGLEEKARGFLNVADRVAVAWGADLGIREDERIVLLPDGMDLRRAVDRCGALFGTEALLAVVEGERYSHSQIRAVFQAGEREPEAYVLAAGPQRGKDPLATWLRLLYGLELTDPHTGLRCCRTDVAMRLLRYKGESAVSTLIAAKRQQVTVREVPVETVSVPWAVDRSVRLTLVRHLLSYMLSSSAAAVTDVVVFVLLAQVIFPESTHLYTMLAVVIARVMSSMVNFLINNNRVFFGNSRKAVGRYYSLWVVQMACSYGIVELFAYGLGLPLTPVKLVGDGCLSIISYRIQCAWVYKREEEGFYGPLARFARSLFRLFSRRYDTDAPREEAVVYVCRHLNMHGPYTTLKWLPTHVHAMVIHVFFDERKAQKHLTEYTFAARRGKKARKFNVCAWLISRLTVPLMKSLQAIPVYRGSNRSICTLKQGLKYLMKNENLIVYPDVDYMDDAHQESEIYKGFLLLGDLYYRKTGKGLKFVPLTIDDSSRLIRCGTPVEVKDYRTEGENAAETLKSAIHGS